MDVSLTYDVKITLYSDGGRIQDSNTGKALLIVFWGSRRNILPYPLYSDRISREA